jgi:EmrB/QacA subfamily drug resistance transporter
MAQQQDSSTEKGKRNGIHKWLVLLTVCISNIIGPMDNSMVNISLPELTVAFNTELSTIIWILLAYMLTLAGLLLTLGRVGDVLGRKRVYVTGFVLFTLGLALCALAQNIVQLIIFRVIQAVGAAMTVAMANAIVTSTFGAQERGKALGILGTAVGIGLMSGPALGGFFIDSFGWRSIFYLRLPLSLLGMVMAWVILKDDRSPKGSSGFDIWGALTLFIGLAGLLFAINQGEGRGWSSPFILTLGGASVALLSIFLIIERRLAQPILDLTLFRHAGFALANVSLFLSFLGRRGLVLILPFLLIQASQYPATVTGLLLMTTPLTMTVVAPLSGWLSDKIGSRFLCPLGLAINLFGIFLLRDLGMSSTWGDIVLRLLIMGVGGSLFETPNNSFIMGVVSQQRLGTASAMIATMRTIGQSAGLAIAAAVFSSRQFFHASHLSFEQAIVAGFTDTVFVALLISGLAFLVTMVQMKPARQA